MSRTIKLVLPDPAIAQLDDLAASADTRVATLASQLLQHAISQATDQGKPPPSPRPIRPHRAADRAPWLEPCGGDPKWRTTTWGAIVALHARYPRHLEHLKDKWWKDDAQTETLAALAYWRQELDDTGIDPRQELAFHAQLNDYTHQLRQQSGGTSKAWRIGPQGESWPNE
jgi:hypothetical protein